MVNQFQIPIVIHVVSKNGDTLVFTPDLATPSSTDYIEVLIDKNLIQPMNAFRSALISSKESVQR